MVAFKTRKKDGRVFVSKDGTDKASIRPLMIRSRISKIRGKIERQVEQRLEQKTKQEELRLQKAQKKLEVRLGQQTIKSERTQKVLAKAQQLQALKAQSRETERQLEVFTLKGKIKRRIRTKIEQKRAFDRTPKGQRIKARKQAQRKKLFKKIVKALE